MTNRRWKVDFCCLCGRTSSYHRNKNESLECTMMTSGTLRIHIACKDLVVEGIAQTLDRDLANVALFVLGFRT